MREEKGREGITHPLGKRRLKRRREKVIERVPYSAQTASPPCNSRSRLRFRWKGLGKVREEKGRREKVLEGERR